MDRRIKYILKDHFEESDKMAFVSGPRQVGKTTCSKQVISDAYLNWDIKEDRLFLTKGPAETSTFIKNTILKNPPIGIVFDEIHKFSKWKNFLKGFYDAYKDEFQVIVTGSSRLNIYKKGGDSLMGRYFIYRLHPLSIGEIINPRLFEQEISPPQKIDTESLDTLLNLGGFPEPFLKGSLRFYNKWQNLRSDQLFYEDLRDLSNIHEINQMQVLAEILKHQSGKQANYSNLAKDVHVSIDTIVRWLSVLESFYFCFRVKPWHKNVPKSLKKQPKIYLWDWSINQDMGARNENFVASHLLKAVHWWTDIGLGKYDLFYLRDKNKREVDFLVTKNEQPWFLVEVKSSSSSISKSLYYFSELLQIKHAFQIVFDKDYVDCDCFTLNEPRIIPVSTFLSQIV